jgi:hypothetical protein
MLLAQGDFSPPENILTRTIDPTLKYGWLSALVIPAMACNQFELLDPLPSSSNLRQPTPAVQAQQSRLTMFPVRLWDLQHCLPSTAPASQTSSVGPDGTYIAQPGDTWLR